MSHDVNRTTEYKYTVEGQLSELIVRNSVTGDQVTKWHYGTTLADSAVASKSLLRAKVYPDSDDVGPGEDGSDDVFDRVEVGYNRQSQTTGMLDQNGTEHRFEYDRLGRLTHDRVTALGTAIDGAVRRISRQYHRTGKLERLSSWDQADAGAGNAVNEVLLRYNGFGQLTREYQSHSGHVATGSTPVVQYAYADGTNRHIRKLATTYPNGREIAYSYGTPGDVDDKLGRVHEILDATADDEVLARYTRRGISATMRIEYPNAGSTEPVEMTYIKQGTEADGPAGDQYTGQDRFNRIIDIRWLRSGTTTHVDRIQYGFDRAGNRLWRKNVVAASNWDELYSYDGLYQLPERQRGTLDSGHTALTGTPLDQEQFTYDPAGNWDEYVTEVNGSTTLDQARTHNRANEITAIDASSSLVAHDAAGNMTKFPKVGNWSTAQSAVWDAWNRLLKIQEGSTIVGEYAYDGFSRRVWKGFGDGPSGRIHFYYSDHWQVLEERIGTNEYADRTFVWGLRYIDDLILRDVGSQRLYATHDQWHVISSVDTNGDATERFAYRAFGITQVLAPNFTPRSSSISGWETTYGAYRWDVESRLYCVRFRYLHPGLGRWLSRDPLAEIDGANLLAYVRNAPMSMADPIGLQGDATFENVRIGPNVEDPENKGRFSAAMSAAVEDTCCDKVAFIQLIKREQSGLPPPLDGIWHIDYNSEGAEQPYPCYPLQQSQEMVYKGRRTLSASMRDSPGDYNLLPIRWGVLQYETCLVCVEGPNIGYIYGCYSWLVSFNRNTDTQTCPPLDKMDKQPSQPPSPRARRLIGNALNPSPPVPPSNPFTNVSGGAW